MGKFHSNDRKNSLKIYVYMHAHRSHHSTTMAYHI